MHTCSAHPACFDFDEDIVISNIWQGNLNYGEVLCFGIPAMVSSVYRQFLLYVESPCYGVLIDTSALTKEGHHVWGNGKTGDSLQCLHGLGKIGHCEEFSLI